MCALPFHLWSLLYSVGVALSRLIPLCFLYTPSRNEKNWEDARALFSELRRLYSYSRYAKLAALRLADIDFEQGKYAEAIGAYRTFIRGHRSDPNVEYAKYRICKALFLASPNEVIEFEQ